MTELYTPDYIGDILANNRVARAIYDRYGISIDATERNKKDIPFLKDARPASIDDFSTSLEVIKAELSKYPDGYIHRLGINAFRVFGKLYVADRRYRRSVVPKPHVSILGLASTEPRNIYMSVEGGDYETIASILHHELFHLADFAYTPKKTKRSRKDIRSYSQKSWILLNEKGKDAYKEGITAKVNDDNEMICDEGFISPLCQENDIEDRAYLAEVLMMGNDNVKRLLDQIDDEVVAKKFQKLKRIYRRRSNGLMDNVWFSYLL